MYIVIQETYDIISHDMDGNSEFGTNKSVHPFYFDTQEDAVEYIKQCSKVPDYEVVELTRWEGK